MNLFGYEAIHTTLETFSGKIPELLSSHPATVKYSVGLDRLLDRVECPFTVAVTGQMRVGKSTLLNALIGEDLAITGVNETTATINWFKYGGEELRGRFNVAWKDAPDELFPMEQIQEWVGDSEKAAQTRYLEFFSASELLKKANFIDTPGTRSVISSHEETINEFLAQRCEKESMRQGGSADAIIYVFPVVARESDKDRLGFFGEGSRIPGSSPFNSIGVLHKWDHLSDEDPFDAVEEKAKTVSEAMKGLVADVIPVSAPLFIAAERFDDCFWEKVTALSRLKDTLDFEELLVLDERDFTSEPIEGCALSPDERTALRSDYPLPWVSLCLIIKQIRRANITDPVTARQFFLEKSGLPRLQRELKQRFFSKSRLIKILGCLNRAWEPCQQASIVLRNEKTQLARELTHLPDYQTYLEHRGAEYDETGRRLSDFIARSQIVLQDRINANGDALSNVDRARLVASDLRDSINNDLDSLEKLEQAPTGLLNDDVRQKLLTLFGYYGCEIEQRCAAFSSDNLEDELLSLLESVEDAPLSKDWKNVREHTELRVNQLLDALEEQQKP